MQIYTIYKITNNLNNKSYIGFDSNYPKRINDHKKYHLSDKVKNKNCIFYKALRKYGWGNFSHSILYQSKDKNYTLNIMENYFIEEYKTYAKLKNSFGYNMTIGGDGVLNASDFWTEDRKNKQSIFMKNKLSGIPKTAEHKNNLKGPRINFNQSKEKNNSAQKIKTPYGIFNSIKDAEFKIKKFDININYSKICYKLNAVNENDWTYINKKHNYNKSNINRPKNNKKCIQTPYGIFPSIKEAIHYIIKYVDYHISYDMIKTRIRNEKYTEWNYL